VAFCGYKARENKERKWEIGKKRPENQRQKRAKPGGGEASNQKPKKIRENRGKNRGNSKKQRG